MQKARVFFVVVFAATTAFAAIGMLHQAETVMAKTAAMTAS